MRPETSLSDFVRDALNSGKSRADIRSGLKSADWTKLEIDTALNGWAHSETMGAIPCPQRSTSAWDALFYALLFAAFGLMVGHTLHLMMGLITHMIPNPHEIQYGRGLGGLRWSMAAVIVFTPVFFWLHRNDAKACAADPVRRHGTVRRWLATLAIFLAVLTLLGDGIYVIYAFLNGDITARFMAKAGAVAMMSFVVLIYFRRDRQDTAQAAQNPGAAIAALLALAALVASLWLVGGPAQGQKERRDGLRLSDLNQLKNDIAECAVVRETGLPATLTPTDCAQSPQRLTGLATQVTYSRVDAETFELCVALEAPDRMGQSYNARIDGEVYCQIRKLR